MRAQKARITDWLFRDEDAAGTIAAAQEPFDSFGPIDELRRVGQQARPPTPQGAHDCARILVAESDPYHRRVLRVLLANPRISVIEVEDGQSAVDLLSLRAFDLILLGVDLPIMAGPEVVRWVRRSNAPWADIPILGMIDEAGQRELGRMLSWGLTDWTPKPISRQHLGGKLVGLLPDLARARL